MARRSLMSTSWSAGGNGMLSMAARPEEVLIRIHVPELKVERCLPFSKSDLVWEVKQQALANLPKDLRESFNYGLFYPPLNGRAGKFLDEERPLSAYPFFTSVGYLELKYKRRVYKMLHLEEKCLRILHSKVNLQKFLEHIKDNNQDKVSKLCSKGFDPNFHCQETGETPLTLTARQKKCRKMIITLVNGGALLDYRTKDGVTAVHAAVQADNYDAVRTLLDLGASSNYRDAKGLTPLYYTVTHSTNPLVCEALLYDYSVIGASDNQGWQETHQACRNKLPQHLKYLLLYGADMNVKNASGNTPLHVCAVDNLHDCAQVLLNNGCDKNALNFANQTPYQVAVIAGNMELAQIIQNHRFSHDGASFKDSPKYNPKRRISCTPLLRTCSNPCVEVSAPEKRLSPSFSNKSNPPFRSTSSLSEGSTESGSVCNSEANGVLSSSSVNEINVHGSDGAREDNPPAKTWSSASHSVHFKHPETMPHRIDNISSDNALNVRPSSCNKECRTMPRMKRPMSEPRTVILQRGTKGFGFVLRGAKATSGFVEKSQGGGGGGPAFQYLDDVDPGGVAEGAGLKKGDYILEINGEDVSRASHEQVVNIIKKSGDRVELTVMSPNSLPVWHTSTINQQQSSFIWNYNNLEALERGCQTLPRKLNAGKVAVTPPAPPPRDPRTTLSAEREKAKSLVADLQNVGTSDCESMSLDSNFTSFGVTSKAISIQEAIRTHPLVRGLRKVASLPPVKQTEQSSLQKKVKAIVAQGCLRKTFYSTPDLRVKTSQRKPLKSGSLRDLRQLARTARPGPRLVNPNLQHVSSFGKKIPLPQRKEQDSQGTYAIYENVRKSGIPVLPQHVLPKALDQNAISSEAEKYSLPRTIKGDQPNELKHRTDGVPVPPAGDEAPKRNLTFSRTGNFFNKSDNNNDSDDSSENENAYSLREKLPLKKVRQKRHSVLGIYNLIPSSRQEDSHTYALSENRRSSFENKRNAVNATSISSSSVIKDVVSVREAINKFDAITVKLNEAYPTISEKLKPPATNQNSKVTNFSSQCPSANENSGSQFPNKLTTRNGGTTSSGSAYGSQQVAVPAVTTTAEVVTDTATDTTTDDTSEPSESSDETTNQTWFLATEKHQSDSSKECDSSTSSGTSSSADGGGKGSTGVNKVSAPSVVPPPLSSSYHRPSSNCSPAAAQPIMRIVPAGCETGAKEHSSLQKPQSSVSLSSSAYHTLSMSQTNMASVSPSRQESNSRHSTYGTTRVSSNYAQAWQSYCDSGVKRRNSSYVPPRFATLDRNFFNSNKYHQNSRAFSDGRYRHNIEESLQLIKMHKESLNEVNSLAGISSKKEVSGSDMVLAPPPQFCDQSAGGSKAVPKADPKKVIYIPNTNSENTLPVKIIKIKGNQRQSQAIDHRPFQSKPIMDWVTKDTTEWLESLSMPEYKESFAEHSMDGTRLLALNNESLINLGIRKISHRIKIEKSLKYYRPVERIDL